MKSDMIPDTQADGAPSPRSGFCDETEDPVFSIWIGMAYAEVYPSGWMRLYTIPAEVERSEIWLDKDTWQKFAELGPAIIDTTRWAIP